MRREIALKKLPAGFTLIEVLLAMAITTFIALLAYSGLSTSMIAAESQQLQARQIANVQLPLTVLERDIRNAVARPIRDEYDDRIEAMVGGAFNDYLLILTRRGWDNPRELSRGELQRVRYQLLDDELWRESWSVLDRVSEEAGQQRTLLLQGISDIEIAFLDSESSSASRSPLGGEWLDEWNIAQRLPAAIKIQFELEGFGEVARVISIPSL
ncbi:MAG: type II secretion system minor pseudopilin GspJ [Oceanicoccus sp.]